MSDPVRVRRLREEDADGWRVLWSGYLAFYRADLTDEVTESTFRRLRDGEGGLVGLVAVDVDERPLGLAHLVFHGTTWSEADYCYLEDLYVDPSRRGGGVARALFAAVYAEARRHGADRVYWHTQEYNAPARSLYDTVGQPTSFVMYEHLIG